MAWVGPGREGAEPVCALTEEIACEYMSTLAIHRSQRLTRQSATSTRHGLAVCTPSAHGSRGRQMRRNSLGSGRMSVFPPGVLPRQLANSPAIQHMFNLPRPKPIRTSSIIPAASTSAQPLPNGNTFPQAVTPEPTTSSIGAITLASPSISTASDPWKFADMRSEAIAVEQRRIEQESAVRPRDPSPHLEEQSDSRIRTREYSAICVSALQG